MLCKWWWISDDGDKATFIIDRKRHNDVIGGLRRLKILKLYVTLIILKTRRYVYQFWKDTHTFSNGYIDI